MTYNVFSGTLNPAQSITAIGSVVFAGLTNVTDRPKDRSTNHTTRSVTKGRIYICSTVMRPNKYRYSNITAKNKN